MKRLLLLLIVMLWTLLVNAQNSGQSSESSSLKLELGGTYNYKAVVKATNKQSCIANVKFDHNGQTIIKPIPAFGSDTILVTLPDCIVKAKPMTNCGDANGDMGWVEINLCAALPVTFEWIQAENIDNYTIVKFKIQSHEGKRDLAFNFTMPNGSKKKYNVRLPIGIKPGDIWEVTVNRINGSYTTKKLW